MQQVEEKDYTKQCKLFMSFNEYEQARKEFTKKERTFASSITYLNDWKHFHGQFRRLFSHCFSMLYETIDTLLHLQKLEKYFLGAQTGIRHWFLH